MFCDYLNFARQSVLQFSPYRYIWHDNLKCAPFRLLFLYVKHLITMPLQFLAAACINKCFNLIVIIGYHLVIRNHLSEEFQWFLWESEVKCCKSATVCQAFYKLLYFPPTSALPISGNLYLPKSHPFFPTTFFVSDHSSAALSVTSIFIAYKRLFMPTNKVHCLMTPQRTLQRLADIWQRTS